jgi:acyl-CoA synthetase (AMP-forming)/AMP-acid ligase II
MVDRMLGWLFERLREFDRDPALIWQDQPHTYRQLLDAVLFWQGELRTRGIQRGDVVGIYGDYSPGTCALLIALIGNGNIAVPLTPSVANKRETFLDITRATALIQFDTGTDTWTFERRSVGESHPLIEQLRAGGGPGLVLFSSGSTGESKAALHHFDKLLAKFERRGHTMRTLSFLLLDHIGGINTLFYILSNGGTVISSRERSPDAICRAIERHRVELLPTSPTFLNMLLISGAYQAHDLSSLRMITYGTEAMPPSTLKRLHEALPKVKLKQTYGLSELGILRSESRDSSSLWVKVGGEDYETKVVDRVLWIRAKSSMLGYLNAPSPFTPDGWYNTGDLVEVDGEYLHILGRASELINVGGEKVYPAEVESVLLEMENVRDATVYGKRNPVIGTIVAAMISVVKPEDPSAFERRMRQFCETRLARYKVPVVVQVSDDEQFSARFKKLRPHAKGS